MQIFRRFQVFDIDWYGSTAVMLLCVLGWLLLYQPLAEKLSQRQNDRKEFQQTYDSARTEITRWQELDRQRESLIKTMHLTGDIIRDSGGLPQVIREMGRLAGVYGMRLNEITPDLTEAAEHYQKTAVLLRLEGSFPKFNLLLNRMVEQLQFVRISALEIKNTNQVPPLDRCEITMALDIFALP